MVTLPTPVIIGVLVALLAATVISRRRAARTRAAWESVTRDTIARLRDREERHAG